jgi:hypothetical protein
MSEANDRLTKIMRQLEQLVTYRGEDELISNINVLLQSNLHLSPNDLWDFFRSAGGRFAIAKRGNRPKKNDQVDKNGERQDSSEPFEIRKSLKVLAQLTIDKIEMNMRSTSGDEKQA